MGRVDNKNAIVTGAARGIGRAIALKLAAEGANVVIVDVNLDQANETAKEIEKLGKKSMAMKVDVTNYGDVESLMEKVKAEWGSVDILVNNAGITRDNLILKMTPEDFDLVININLKGVFNGIKAAFPVMMKQRSGKIINMASVIGQMGNVSQANYAASKAGVIALTKTAAKELAKRGVCVNAIAPGYIQTPMTDQLSDQVKQYILGMIPMERMGQPEDVANMVLFLAGSESDYVTGHVFNVDGGMVMA
ncbi:MAG: 3-oxoacyl-[acyl-carrier-protein] reductase [Spirochaetes bacterium GWF1_51_8]|nr:MAG: 3-oxoacyl-[acyl-carrier-protein] reductase [Spirochaetes bacterium GWF1_51_8]